MSWPYVAAAWKLELGQPMLQLTALALADQADTRGEVRLSLTQLGAMTFQSEQTVRRSLRVLRQRGLLTGDSGSGRRYGRYVLHYLTAAQSTPADAAEGCHTVRGATESGVPRRKRGVPHSHDTSTFTDPVVQKSRGALPRLEIPTRDQVTKLAHVLIDDDAVEIASRPDLDELLKSACARAGFRYDGAVVTEGINRALAQRGLNPNLPLDVARARRRG